MHMGFIRWIFGYPPREEHPAPVTISHCLWNAHCRPPLPNFSSCGVPLGGTICSPNTLDHMKVSTRVDLPFNTMNHLWPLPNSLFCPAVNLPKYLFAAFSSICILAPLGIVLDSGFYGLYFPLWLSCFRWASFLVSLGLLFWLSEAL